MKAILTTAAAALLLLTGCASTKPGHETLEQALARHDAALAQLEMQIAQLHKYVKGGEKHQDDALVGLFDRLAQAEQVLNQHSKRLNGVQVRSGKDYWYAVPKRPVALP